MTAECSGSLDIYNGAGEIGWLNGMQHYINYGLKFVFVFQYSCGRFFSEKKKKGKNVKGDLKDTIHLNSPRGRLELCSGVLGMIVR